MAAPSQISLARSAVASADSGLNSAGGGRQSATEITGSPALNALSDDWEPDVTRRRALAELAGATRLFARENATGRAGRRPPPLEHDSGIGDASAETLGFAGNPALSASRRDFCCRPAEWTSAPTVRVRTSSGSSALASTDWSVRDGAVVSLIAAAVLLVEPRGHHVDVTA